MPIVLRIKGYRFWFYEADLDEPPHVHIGRDGKEAKYWVAPISVARPGRFREQELKEIERIFWKHGEGSSRNVVTVKARVKTYNNDYDSVVPIVVPDFNEVREFAAKLHAKGKTWKGEAFGWQAEYNPERAEPPLDSKMTFTPADFCIGESGIWFFSLMWEHGREAEPVEFVDDQNILEKVT